MISVLRSPFVSAVWLAAVLVSGASAQIVHSGPVDLTLTMEAANQGAYLVLGFGPGGESVSARVDADLTSTDGLYFVTVENESAFYLIVAGRDNAYLAQIALAANNVASNLTFGAPIDGDSASFGDFGNMNYDDDGSLSRWSPGSTGYLGFDFVDGATLTHYGWAQLSYNPDHSLTLHDFAYEASGASILAGDTGASAVPEPSTYAALAGLLVGVFVLYVRRRSCQPTALRTVSRSMAG